MHERPSHYTPTKDRLRELKERKGRIDQTVRELGMNVTHEITLGFLVDDKGNYHLLRKSRGELVDHQFPTIDQALNQIERVIETKLGFQEKIGRQIKIKFTGENEELVKIGAGLIESAKLYPTLPLKQQAKYAQEMAEMFLPALTNAQNVYKKRAAEILRTIIASEPPDTAEKLIEAGGDAFEAAIHGIHILTGETIRLIGGAGRQDVWERRAIDVYGRLLMHYDKFRSLEGEKRKACVKGIIYSLRGRWGIKDKLNSIKGNPYFKRIQSREIRRLDKLEHYLEDENFEAIERTLVGAIKKLRAIPRDRSRRINRLTGKPARR